MSDREETMALEALAYPNEWIKMSEMQKPVHLDISRQAQDALAEDMGWTRGPNGEWVDPEQQPTAMPLRPLNGNDARTILMIAADEVDLPGINQALDKAGYTPYVEMFKALTGS